MLLWAWVRTVAFSSGLAMLADSACQGIEISFRRRSRRKALRQRKMGVIAARLPRQRYDAVRAGRFAFTFGVAGGSASFFWYTYILPRLINDKTVADIILKVIVDNFTYDVAYCAGGLALNQYLVDGSAANVGHRLRQDFVGTFCSGLLVGIPFDALVFFTLPVEGGYQSVGIKAGAAVWLTIASYFINRDLASRVAAEDGEDNDPDSPRDANEVHSEDSDSCDSADNGKQNLGAQRPPTNASGEAGEQHREPAAPAGAGATAPEPTAAV